MNYKQSEATESPRHFSWNYANGNSGILAESFSGPLVLLNEASARLRTMLQTIMLNSASYAPRLADVKPQHEFPRTQTREPPITIYAPNIGFAEFELCAKLRACANLPDDWDGYGGRAPASEDIENAVRFISHIPESALFSAQLMVAGDGDVGFRWRQKDRFLEIGFSDGEISFYGETPSGESNQGEELFANTVPANLRDLMRSVFAD